MSASQVFRAIQDLRLEVELLRLGLQEINDRMDSIPLLTELLAKHEDAVRRQGEGEDLVG